MSDTMTIKTNNQYRHTIDWDQLTDKERREFDYLETVGERMFAEFTRYKGQVYDVSEFMHINGCVAPHPQRQGWEQWDGYHSDSYFSGILIRRDQSGRVCLATYYC